MRRRLTFTIVGVVAGALLVAGVGTLVLARRAAQRDTRQDLVRQAQAVAQAADEISRPAAIAAIRQALKLDNAAFGAVPAADSDVARTSRPASRPPTWARSPTPHRCPGITVRWSSPAPSPSQSRGRVAVVLTRQLPSAGGGVGFFLLAAALALMIAAVVGDRLGHRIAKPLEDAEAATRRIATGDLEARVPGVTDRRSGIGFLDDVDQRHGREPGTPARPRTQVSVVGIA